MTETYIRLRSNRSARIPGRAHVFTTLLPREDLDHNPPPALDSGPDKLFSSGTFGSTIAYVPAYVVKESIADLIRDDEHDCVRKDPNIYWLWHPLIGGDYKPGETDVDEHFKAQTIDMDRQKTALKIDEARLISTYRRGDKRDMWRFNNFTFDMTRKNMHVLEQKEETKNIVPKIVTRRIFSHTMIEQGRYHSIWYQLL